MNIGAVIGYLNKTYGYDLNSSYYTYIAEWRDWWTGFHRPFHHFVEMRQNKPIHRELFTLHMGKKVCEDWASLLMNDKTRIDAGEQNQVFLLGNGTERGLFDELAFWLRENELIERAFATGTGAAVLRFENMLVQGGAVQPDENCRICVDYLTAENIVPLTVTPHSVQDVAFATDTVYNGKTYTYVSMHRLIGGEYVICNAYFSEEAGELKPAELPEGVAQEYHTGSRTPLFSLISPNIVKNFYGGAGLGVSVLANALDQLKGVDLAYNNFCRDFKLGGKKVFYDQSLVQMDENGHPVTPDDIMQSLFFQLGDGCDLGENHPITEYNPSLRVEENIAGIQAALDYLSLRVGFGTKHYQFNSSSIVTATQYNGDKQDLVQNANKNQISIETALIGIVRGILWAAKNLLGAEVDPETAISVNWDDSYITDAETRMGQMRDDALSGLLPRYKYLAARYGVSEEEARKLAEEARTENQQPELSFGGGA